jgi:hypothetical protein
MNIRYGFTSVALCLVVGCAGSAMSPSKLAASEASVRGAEEAGAREEPQAGLHLKYAKDQLAEAKILSQRGDGEEADRMLARAQADAELAIAFAKQGSARRVALQVRSEIQKEMGGQK